MPQTAELVTELEFDGQKYEVHYVPTMDGVIQRLINDKPPYITFDTETDGLHAYRARPFLGILCWQGVVYVFPANVRNLNKVWEASKYTRKMFAHNAIFDMCMTANMIGDNEVLAMGKWADSQCALRLVFEAVSVDHGGDALALKPCAKKYIDVNADRYEKEVKGWLKGRVSANNKVLTAMLRSAGFLRKDFDKAMKDETLSGDMKDLYDDWAAQYPEPTYQDVPMEIMLPYAACDGIFVDILMRKSLPMIVERELTGVFTTECELLPSVFKMVRRGFTIDHAYMIASRERVVDYMAILQQRAVELTGITEFKVTKHKMIKGIYEEKLGETLAKVDKIFMQKQAGDELATIIMKLRTCAKWLSTYIDRIIKDCEQYDGRFYPTLNPYQPVTGRFSGDCQQMPKEALTTIDGVELFHPRKAVTVRGGEYNKMAFIDISQYELRWGAHYTLHFGGDTNLCRAYMPFQCYHESTGERFNPESPEHIARWDERSKVGNHSAWRLVGTGEPWTPTDVHSSTTGKAFPTLDPKNKDEWKKWRNYGKRYNFLKFYGGGIAKAAEALEIPYDDAAALNRGFEESFPLLVTYSRDLIERANVNGFATNLYGRRYYLSEASKHYVLANYNIQGGTADDFKKKMVLIDRKLTELECLTAMVHPIHDEIILDTCVGEEWVLDEVKKILEHTPLLHVPIVAEVSTSTTTWSAKE